MPENLNKNAITLYQRNICKKLPDAYDNEYKAILNKLQESADFIFPEYFSFHSDFKSKDKFIEDSKMTLDWLKNLSKRAEAQKTLIFGGTFLMQREKTEKPFNTLPVFYEGEILTTYQKRRLYGIETEYLSTGKVRQTVIHPHDGSKWGLLICADVFLENAFSDYKDCDFIVIPTSSPYRPDDTKELQKERDHEIYAKGSKIGGAFVLKCCGTGEIGSIKENGEKAPKLQGRSLIAHENKILIQAPDINWSGFLQIDKTNGKVSCEEYEN
ncbi:MAG: hypothetical protein OEZ13_12780 [Spirochaetia bacterium]|nr:hypothetical protein [Spirochaetia bacterium]